MKNFQNHVFLSLTFLFLLWSTNFVLGVLPFQGSSGRGICGLSSLTVLDLSNNMFSGPIPGCLGNLSTVTHLNLEKNNFSGTLPDFTQATQLKTLKVRGNKLGGKLPRSLINCTALEVLDLGYNNMHDTFPIWLQKLPSLKVLVLRENRLYGPIESPEDEGGAFSMLRVLDLASNNFSGQLSARFFESLKDMKKPDEDKTNKSTIGSDSYYQDSVTIVNKGLEMDLVRIFLVFSSLDLSDNSFNGKIPLEIQNLKSIRALNLSRNNFSGEIPLTLEDLTQLESLDLSMNDLSGRIPPQLASLTFLAVLNLSYNQLEGIIPQGNQFGTFSISSYEGNPKLCGSPLTKKCGEEDQTSVSPMEDQLLWSHCIFDWKFISMGYGSGLVIGLSVSCSVFSKEGHIWPWCTRRKQSRRSNRLPGKIGYS